MHRDLLAYAFDAAGLFHPFTFEKCLFTTLQLCKPLLFLSSRRRLNCTSSPNTVPLPWGQRLLFIVLCGGSEFAPFDTCFFLEAWHIGCQPRNLWRLVVCFSFSVEIYFPILYPYTRLDVVHEVRYECVSCLWRERGVPHPGGMGAVWCSTNFLFSLFFAI